MTFNGKLMILKSHRGVIASMTLPPGLLIAEEDMVAYDITGPDIPLGTHAQKEFASVPEAVKHFEDGGFTLTPSSL